MPIGVRMAMFVLVGLLFAASAQAAQLFPLQTGQWMEMDKHDNLNPPNTWTVRIDVLGEVTLDGTKYFHVREKDYDPSEGDVLSDFYIRSTDTEAYSYNGPGLGETLGFKLGPVGTNWIYESGTKKKEIVAIESITIPYGGTYNAYKYKHYRISTPDQYDLEWVVPGLGWIAKEEDHWVSNPARIPLISVLARMKTPATSVARYSFVDIDYPGVTTTLNDIRGLNNLGQIVGSYTLGGRQYAFIKNGGTYSTLSLPGTSNIAWGINDNGQVVGAYDNHGYIYNTSNSNLTTIDVPGNPGNTAVWGINDAGKISGHYWISMNYAFMYDGSYWTLLNKVGATATNAFGINDAGTIAGNYTMDKHDYGFTYYGGIFHDLNVPGAQNTRAVGINDHGDIVGRYWNDGGAIQGYIYANGVFKTLHMPGAEIVRVLGINNAKQIVGLYTKDAGSSYHGFIGTPVPTRGLPALQLLLLDYSQ